MRALRTRLLQAGLLALTVAGCTAPRPATPAASSGGTGTAPGAASAAPASAAPAPAAALSRETFHLAYPNLSLSYLPILMARDLGYYDEEGLDADVLLMRANVGQAALVAGEIDFTASVGSNIKMALQGAPIKTILLFVQAQVMSLVAQPQYRTPESLRGKTVGVGVAGASVDQVARLILKHYGLEPQRDVSVVPVGDGAIQYQALQLGQMDAVVLSLPYPVLARRDGYAIVANAPDLFKLPSGGVGTMQSTLDQRRDMVRRVARAQIRALQYIRAQPEAAAKFIEQFFDMDYATARESYDFLLPAFTAAGEVDREAMDLQLEMERSEGTVVTMGYEQLVDPTVASEAARDLGLGHDHPSSDGLARHPSLRPAPRLAARLLAPAGPGRPPPRRPPPPLLSPPPAAATAPPDTPAALIRVPARFAYPNLSLSFLPLIVARDMGHYVEEGLDAELIEMRANVGQAALVSGEVDYTASLGSNVKMALQGAPIKVVFMHAPAPVMALVAQPQFRTPNDLRGKTVGVGVPGARLTRSRAWS